MAAGAERGSCDAGEIEDLTTGLCQKIWQKMNMLQRVDDERPRPASEG